VIPSNFNVFGPKKRQVQREFYRLFRLTDHKVLILVDRSCQGWKVMHEAGAKLENTVALTLTPATLATFTHACRVAGIEPPNYRAALDLRKAVSFIHDSIDRGHLRALGVLRDGRSSDRGMSVSTDALVRRGRRDGMGKHVVRSLSTRMRQPVLEFSE